MTNFSGLRIYHQQATPGEVTGEIPTPALLCGSPHDEEDGTSRGDVSQEQLPYRDMLFGWAGCIDAPTLIPTGAHVAAIVNGMFEGTVAATFVRGV